MVRWGKGVILGLSLGFLLQTPGFAGTPSGKEVGSEEERIRRPKPEEVPTLPAAPVELPPDEALPPPPRPGEKFRVERVAVEGATLLPDEQIKKPTAPLIGKTATLEDLQAAARAITQWYRGRGYIASRVFVPAQTVENGLVRIRVIEGKRGELKVEGNRFFSTELLTAHVKIRPGEILYLPKLEAALRSLNAHPDRKAKLVLTRGSRPETTDLILQVTDRQALHASYGVDTLGTKVTGAVRQSVTVSHGNLTGHDDQALIRGIMTEFGGLKGGAFSYLRPLTPGGATATLDVSGVISDVGGDLKNLLARGNAVTVSPGLIVPWVRRSNWEMETVTGFDWKRIRTRQDEVSTSKDDLRVLHAGTNLLAQDTRGQSFVSQELRWGIGDFLGGSHGEDPAASRAGAGGSFLHWNVNLARVQKGPWGTSLVLRGAGRLASARLVPAEQLRLGGFDTVRGYPEGEFLADYGYQTSVEVRAPLSRFWPAAEKAADFTSRLRRSFLLVGFWDFAEGFLRASRLGEDEDMRLSGIGCGFRLRPTSESLLQVDVGWPVGDRDAEKDRPRIHLICRVAF